MPAVAKLPHDSMECDPLPHINPRQAQSTPPTAQEESWLKIDSGFLLPSPTISESPPIQHDGPQSRSPLARDEVHTKISKTASPYSDQNFQAGLGIVMTQPDIQHTERPTPLIWREQDKNGNLIPLPAPTPPPSGGSEAEDLPAIKVRDFAYAGGDDAALIQGSHVSTTDISRRSRWRRYSISSAWKEAGDGAARVDFERLDGHRMIPSGEHGGQCEAGGGFEGEVEGDDVGLGIHTGFREGEDGEMENVYEDEDVDEGCDEVEIGEGVDVRDGNGEIQMSKSEDAAEEDGPIQRFTSRGLALLMEAKGYDEHDDEGVDSGGFDKNDDQKVAQSLDEIDLDSAVDQVRQFTERGLALLLDAMAYSLGA